MNPTLLWSGGYRSNLKNDTAAAFDHSVSECYINVFCPFPIILIRLGLLRSRFNNLLEKIRNEMFLLVNNSGIAVRESRVNTRFFRKIYRRRKIKADIYLTLKSTHYNWVWWAFQYHWSLFPETVIWSRLTSLITVNYRKRTFCKIQSYFLTSLSQ